VLSSKSLFVPRFFGYHPDPGRSGIQDVVAPNDHYSTSATRRRSRSQRSSSGV